MVVFCRNTGNVVSFPFRMQNVGGKWNNLNCGVKQNFICKKLQNATSTIATPTATPISGGCPDGWVQAKEKCFKVFSGDANMKTRMDAAVECRKYNDGFLAVIGNVGEQGEVCSVVCSSKVVILSICIIS